MLEKYEVCCGLFHGFDRAAWLEGTPAEPQHSGELRSPEARDVVEVGLRAIRAVGVDPHPHQRQPRVNLLGPCLPPRHRPTSSARSADSRARSSSPHPSSASARLAGSRASNSRRASDSSTLASSSSETRAASAWLPWRRGVDGRMDELGDRKTKNFRREMAAAGDPEVQGVPYPWMQLITVPDILEGKRFHTPGAVGRGELQPVLPGSSSP